MLRARGTDSDAPQYAEQPLTIGGGDVSDLTIILAPGATISGTVTFQPTTQPLPRCDPGARDRAGGRPNGFGANPNAKVEKDGQFTPAPVRANALRMAA